MLFQAPKIPKFTNFRIPSNFQKTLSWSILKKQFLILISISLFLKLQPRLLLNYLMNPLVGFVDTFWVGRLGSDLDIAGQGYADDIYNLILGSFVLCLHL